MKPLRNSLVLIALTALATASTSCETLPVEEEAEVRDQKEYFHSDLQEHRRNRAGLR